MKHDEIKNLIKEIIEKISVSVHEVSLDLDASSGKSDSSRPEMLWFSVSVSDPHLFSDKDGEGLSALNHIIKKILESKNKDADINKNNTEPSVLIDINGFQKKKVDNIRAIAHMMAERARYFKSNIEIDPMPAFERRIIHEFLSDAIDLKTESEGEGRTRRVVIKYIGSI